MALYETRQLSFSYPGEAVPALSELTLDIGAGEFAVLCGGSGGGKTTLLRQLKTALTPHGRREGSVRFRERPLGDWSRLEQAARIGYLQQSPENQLVTQKVWHELAFGLENIGLHSEVIRQRVMETAAHFGMESWLHRDISTLSGGEKQLLNLAAILAMKPEVLLLDEPTAQLDPAAAARLLSEIAKINRDLGVTVLLSEHRLEEVLPYAGRLLLLEEGRLLFDGSPSAAGEALRAHRLWDAMPTPMRVWAGVESASPCPVSIREGRAWLDARVAERPLCPPEPEACAPLPAAEPSACLEQVCFRYGRGAPALLEGLSLRIPKGRITAVLGENGAGKTTLQKLICGLLKPDMGSIRLDGRPALLPQDPRALFMKTSLRLDLLEVISDEEDERGREARLCEIAALCHLEAVLERHPFDLSGGERQRAALAKMLLTKPDILLLDEPTKGMDAAFKLEFAEILKKLCAQGISILMVSHDVEFCARHAEHCALLSGGAIVDQGPPRQFFANTQFYTTAANRMARHLLPQAVTAGDILKALGAPQTEAAPTEFSTPLLRPVRRELSEENMGEGKICKPSLPLRSKLSILLCLLLIPLTIFAGLFWLEGSSYYLICLLVIVEAMLPFAISLEGRRPQARELVLLAVLCALGVAGRAAFFWLPQCKPLVALMVVTGMALGGEAGFLVGAMTGFLSGFFFGQGPWTPWQMFAFGLIGLLAGLLLRKPPKRHGRLLVALFGGFLALALYGPLMDLSTALMLYGNPSVPQLLAVFLLGLPFNLLHGVATVAFLLLGGPLLRQALTRIKRKYGLLDQM